MSEEYHWEPRCRKCKAHLFGDIEIEMMYCDRCADNDYHRSQKRREWDYYHPDEPCPKCELE